MNTDEEKYYLCLKEYFESKDFIKKYCIPFNNIIPKNNKYFINNKEIQFIYNNNLLDSIKYNNMIYYLIDKDNVKFYYNQKLIN